MSETKFGKIWFHDGKGRRTKVGFAVVSFNFEMLRVGHEGG